MRRLLSFSFFGGRTSSTFKTAFFFGNRVPLTALTPVDASLTEKMHQVYCNLIKAAWTFCILMCFQHTVKSMGDLLSFSCKLFICLGLHSKRVSWEFPLWHSKTQSGWWTGSPTTKILSVCAPTVCGDNALFKVWKGSVRHNGKSLMHA